MTGLMEVDTDDGTWMVPPYSGVWLPAGKRHQVWMNSVSSRSLYIEPLAAPRPARSCRCWSCRRCWPPPTCPRSMTRMAVTVPLPNSCCMSSNWRRRCRCLRLCRTIPNWPACAETFSASRIFTACPKSGRGNCTAANAPSIVCSVSRPACRSRYGASRPA